MNMEENERRECSVYDRDRVAVGLYKKKSEFSLWKYLLIATLAILGVALVVLLIQNDRFTGFFASLAIGGKENVGQGGNHNGDGGGIHDGVSDREESATGVVGIETEENQNGDTATEDSSAGTGEEDTIPPLQNDCDAVSMDMSCAERGNAYIINYTGIAVDAEGILEMGFHNAKYFYTEHPVVLILHTHTSEGYYDTDKNDPLHPMTHSVVAVGEKLAEELNSRGISTVHCTVIHDGRGSPYSNARETIRTMLEIYPTVEYVIDLHRAELFDENGKAVKVVSPTGEGQIRLSVSSESQKSRDSLALALSLRRMLNENDQRLCMPVIFTSSAFNADLSSYYLKLDVGSVGNNAAEAISSAEKLAEAMAKILKKR